MAEEATQRDGDKLTIAQARGSLEGAASSVEGQREINNFSVESDLPASRSHLFGMDKPEQVNIK